MSVNLNELEQKSTKALYSASASCMVGIGSLILTNCLEAPESWSLIGATTARVAISVPAMWLMIKNAIKYSDSVSAYLRELQQLLDEVEFIIRSNKDVKTAKKAVYKMTCENPGLNKALTNAIVHITKDKIKFDTLKERDRYLKIISAVTTQNAKAK